MAQQKYMFIYHGDFPNLDRHPSPEEMQALFATWDAWKSKFKANVVDVGDALRPSDKVLRGGVVTDGPFVESKDIVGGYSLIVADSYEQALTVARECPIALMPGASIEVRELAGFG